jgi:glutathione-independent formaldehyde dehydrogenase
MIIRVFTANDPGGANEHTKKDEYIFLGNYEKSLTIKTGQTSVKKIILMVRDMIIAGVAKPGFIVSYRISIEDAPAAYRECSQRADCYTKMVIKFKY